MNAEVDRGFFPFVVVVVFLARTRALVPETLITGLFYKTGSGRKLVSGKEAVLLKAGFHMIANDRRRSRIADDRGS